MGRKLRKIILLMPITCLYAILIGGGFYIILRESFGFIPAFGLKTFTNEYYLKAIGMYGFFDSVVFAVLTAIIASSISMILGTLIAYKLTLMKNEKVKSIINYIIRLGMVLPYLYMVFLVILFFGQSGLVSRLLFRLGVITSPSDFPNLLYGPYGLGIIIVYVLKGLPFVVLLVLNVMSKISGTYNDVSMTLGSNRFQSFKKIYLPLSRDTIVWSGMVLMAYDLGSFEVPYIFAHLKQKSLSVMLYSEYLKPSISSIPTTMSMTVMLFVISLICVASFALITRLLIGRLYR